MDTLQYVFPEFLTPSVTGSNINVMTLLRYKDYGSFYNWINIKSKKNVLALKQSLKKKKLVLLVLHLGLQHLSPSPRLPLLPSPLLCLCRSHLLQAAFLTILGSLNSSK